jgi:RNA polymerase sigma-32 factor
MGTTAAQKKLFFNLRRLKGQIKEIDDGDLAPESVKQIATTLAVSEDDVVQMNRRMSGGDQSLNAPMRQDGEAEWQDWLVDDSDTQDIVVAEADELDHRRSMLEAAMATLTERERHIFTERRLRDDPVTLEDLSNDFGVSRERVRQIEVRAFEKVQRAIRNMATQDAIAQTKATERFQAD